MSEKAKNCLERISEIVRDLPEEAVDVILRDAATRAEGVADYLAYTKSGT